MVPRCCPRRLQRRREATCWSGRVILSVRGHAPARDHLCACLRDARACAGTGGRADGGKCAATRIVGVSQIFPQNIGDFEVAASLFAQSAEETGPH
jgi:hypothetical protein